MKNSNAIRVSQILPEDVIANLAAMAADGNRSIWAIARTAQALADELPIRRALLDQAVSQACGWRASRARDARSVACFYPVGIEDEFHQLSFSHFRTAMSSGTLDKARGWIGFCLSSADDYGGQPAPVDVLAAKMREAGDKEAMSLHEKWLAQIGRLLSKLYLHPSTPDAIRLRIGIVLDIFEDTFPGTGDQLC